MTTVMVSGFPDVTDIKKLIPFMKKLLKRRVSNFWIKDVFSMSGSNLVQAEVAFDTMEDAQVAGNIFDSTVYRARGEDYPLLGRIGGNERSPSPYKSYDYVERRDRSYDKYERHYSTSRERSLSPLYSKSYKLDMEIQLLRKQRLIIEEERKLLQEKQKLERIKQLESSRYREFGQPRKRRRSSSERQMYNRGRHNSPPRYKKQRLEKPEPPSIFSFKLKNGVPKFRKICRKLIGDMQPIIERINSEYDSTKYTELMQVKLRKRLATLVPNNRILKGTEIIEMYRNEYPETTDVECVKEILERMGAYIPSEDMYINEEIHADFETAYLKGKSEQPNDTEFTNTHDVADDDTRLTTGFQNEHGLERNDQMRNDCAISLDAPDIESFDTDRVGNWEEYEN